MILHLEGAPLPCPGWGQREIGPFPDSVLQDRQARRADPVADEFFPVSVVTPTSMQGLADHPFAMGADRNHVILPVRGGGPWGPIIRSMAISTGRRPVAVEHPWPGILQEQFLYHKRISPDAEA